MLCSVTTYENVLTIVIANISVEFKFGFKDSLISSEYLDMLNHTPLSPETYAGSLITLQQLANTTAQV